MPGKFETNLEYDRRVVDGNIILTLTSPLIYTSKNEDKILVPLGFESDGASIPKFLWSIVGHPLAEYLESAVIHDFLYNRRYFKRIDCDKIFIEAMETQGVSLWKRNIMYRAVRIFGFFYWLKPK